MSGRSIKRAIASPASASAIGADGEVRVHYATLTTSRCRWVKATNPDIIGSDAALAHELLFECRHGSPLLRDLQHLFLNEWIARRLGEFVAFARLGVVLLGLAFRHGTIPDNLVGVAHKANCLRYVTGGTFWIARPIGCARRRPWTNKCYPLAGTWQIAFLGEIEPRAARPGRPVGE